MNKQHVIDEAVEIIKIFEGYRGKSYQDQAGIWTVGYGMTQIDCRNVNENDTISEDQATFWLHERVTEDYNKLELFCSVHDIEIPDNQAESLLSFVYNIGYNAFLKSSVARDLIEKKFSMIPDDLMKWVNVAGKINDGLVNRRKQEAAIFERDVA